MQIVYSRICVCERALGSPNTTCVLDRYKDAAPAVLEKALQKKRKASDAKARKLVPMTRRSAE